jgi:hypothetical protein
MNRVCQSEWISMTLGDSVMPLLGGGVSWDDSAALLALAKAFVILGSWSSYKKTPVGTTAWLEPRLTNWSAISFFLARYASSQGHQNCFLTCVAPGSIAAFCHPDMTTLCWHDWQWVESPWELWFSGCQVPWRSLDHEVNLHTWLHC